jgi:lipopolysaccharide transport system ATP-binding protein
MAPTIRVENLSKCYRVNHEEGRVPYRTLREDLVRLAAKPWRWLRRKTRCQTEDFWALKEVNFDVQPGEVIGIIGRNGAGKSTLLKILSRITHPTKGKVRLRGRVGSLLEVGTGFHPELTGRENIVLNGVILGMGRREIARKFDEIVAYAEIEKFLDTPVKRYSSGMYVRLAFAVAAHLEPEILIVDEVLAVGDAQFQEKCLGTMEASATSGRTILFVSHNMASIQQLCTRCLLLQAGRVVQEGPPPVVVRSYFAQAQTSSRVSVRDWADRQTNGQARIVHLEITDGQGNVTGSVPVAGRVRFSLVVDFREPVVDPCFGVLVETATGEPILDIRSNHAGLRLGRVEGSVVVQAAVDRLGLYPGEYFLSPWLSDASLQCVIDWPKHCCRLRVDSGPGPHGDLRLDPAWGKYWIPSAWNCPQRIL